MIRTTQWRTVQKTLLSASVKNVYWRDNMLDHGLIIEYGYAGCYICSPLIAEYIIRANINESFMEDIYVALASHAMPYHINNVGANDLPLWKMRLLINAQTQDHLFESLSLKPFTEIMHQHTHFFIDTCDFSNDPSDENIQRFLNKTLAFQFQVLAPLLLNAIITLKNADNLIELAEKCYQQHLQKAGQHEPMFAAMLAQHYLAHNKLDLLPKLLSAKCAWSTSIGACLTLFNGDPKKAVKEFELAIKEKRKETKKRTAGLFEFEELFYLLANVLVGNNAFVIKNTTASMNKQPNSDWNQIHRVLLTGATLANNQSTRPLQQATAEQPIPLAGLFELCLAYWFGDVTQVKEKITLEDSLKLAQQNNYPLFAEQAQAILAKVKGKYFFTSSKTTPLCDLLSPVCKWQRSLDALKNISQTEGNEAVKAKSDSRMVWWLNRNSYDLSPREQKQGKKGAWTKGRAVSLKKLHREIFNYDYLTPQDLKICAHIQEYSDGGWYGSTYFELNEKAIYAAIDHPHLYWAEDKSQAVSLSTESPTLLIAEKGKNLKISLKPFPENEMNIVKEDEYTLKLVNFDAEHHRIAEILTRNGLTVPASAKQQVLDSISTIAPFLTIHSDIGGGTKDCEEVESDKQLYMQISVLDEGVIKIAATICPLGELGPAFPPAQGSKVIMSEIQGKQLQTMRDLADESKQLASLSQIAPALFANEDAQWFIDDPQQALITIEAMQNSDELKLVWQEGKKIKLNKTATTSNMSVKVGKKTDWFELSGSLQVDENTILPLEHLLALISESTGRFIELEKGEYLALTEQLYQRLQRLKGLTRSNKKGLEFHPLASQAMDELSDGMQLKNSAAWKKQVKLLSQAYKLQPELPSTLQATLRDYQLQGFEWLSRLAHWQAGACLADDMGLGKTLQALAIIVNRAKEGPALVLAPTSVCLNWEAEILKFAPTLNIINFSGKDRKQKALNATGFDIVICSYGLLQYEIETLKEIQFSTVVADEAQAIKNPQAKRTQAAMQLNAGFKIITTGTPIENHLGELWSLFNFINPGLLGTLEQFNKQFSTPIEKGDEVASDQLRTLLKPFILRRLKTEVLTELPSRTEINIKIKASDDELAFYEACRRQAVERMTDNEETNQGTKKLKILAEITRLRQACCHPQLVSPDLNISSGKQKAFIELVEDLIENKHKALVFSQFVGHLSLLKAVLIKRNISFQYLDGSTPAKKRQQAVNNFQAGEGDIFLISLKAGGSGLNLTAADYVIHMDPWWNPAVEDQASDRAHRMGQQRPVTIYRMIMENSIEEKIIALHGQKRDLANNLLSGNEKVSGKLDVEQMLALLAS